MVLSVPIFGVLPPDGGGELLMPRLLVLANLELAFDIPEGKFEGEAFARLKERRLLRALQRLVNEHPEVEGSLERLEFESFSYASKYEGESTGYYYNKHDKRAETP